MVNKTLAYEAADSEAAWSHKVMLVADDSAGSFEGFTDYAETYLPAGYTSLKVYRSDYSSDAETEAAICSGFDSGALVTLYAGHGSVGIWSDGPIFDTSDIATLSNTGCLSVVITPTCMNGYFVYPGLEGLAEELLRSANGGAVACISPSGMSMPSDQFALVDSLFATIVDAGAFYPGKALTHALNMTYNELGESSRAIIQTTVYFGDPALKLKQWSGYGNSGQLPVIVGTYPVDGAQNVTTDTEVRITFSKPMDEISVAANLSIAPDVAVSTEWEGNTLIIRPVTAFSLTQTYTVSLKGTAQSLTGQSLDGNTNRVANGSPADDVQFSFAPCWVRVSGAVSYGGRQAGDVYVVALPAEDNWTGPLSITNVSLGNYVLTIPAGTDMRIGAFLDSNNNGILGSAEARGMYALNPLNVTNDRSAVYIVLHDPDSDNDGLPDWVEVIAGTSPTNRFDRFEINSVDLALSNDFFISFQGHTGRIYTLQASPDLGNPSAWTNVGEVTGADQFLVLTNVPAAATGYYRIKVRLAQ
jgi:hypothetical protein